VVLEYVIIQHSSSTIRRLLPLEPQMRRTLDQASRSPEPMKPLILSGAPACKGAVVPVRVWHQAGCHHRRPARAPRLRETETLMTVTSQLVR